MLKFLFPILLLANALLFGYRHGYLESLLPSGREPTRIENQLNPDKLKLVPAPEQQDEPPSSTAPATPPARPAIAPVASVTAREPEVLACTEIGDFNAEDARRFGARLAQADLGAHAVRRALQEVSSHIVYIPPQPDKETVERRAAELRALGVEDFFIILDNSPLRWGISLGVFKQENAARTHLAALAQKGVRGARVGQRMAPSSKVAFQLRKLDGRARSAFDAIAAEFAQQQRRSCTL